ncbi:MAG: radical SAM protein [Planctomycetes bacterium]|nr:radical SAM protein [Planctomycetota bacterium]
MTQTDSQPLMERLVGVSSIVEPFLTLYFTSHCNAACAHCIVESGPRRRGRMSIETARAAIHGASLIEKMKLLVFSGGESFLHAPEVLELCECARHLGMKTRIVTNAFWAKSPERAAEVLELLARRGLGELFVSFDEFHLPWIPPERVLNVFRGAGLADPVVPYVLYCTVVRASRSALERVSSSSGFAWPRMVAETLEAYGFPVEKCVPQPIAHEIVAKLQGEARERFKREMVRERALIAWQDLAQGGRAARELRNEFAGDLVGGEALAACPLSGVQATLAADGRLFPCCSVWTNWPDHGFGRPQTPDEFAGLLEAMREDPYVRFIREVGPLHLVDHFRNQGGFPSERPTNICHACESLLANRSLDQLRAAAREASRADPP